MTTYRGLGDKLKGIKIVVLAESIKTDRKRVVLTANHTGERAVAKGEATAYIDIPFQSTPKYLKGTK